MTHSHKYWIGYLFVLSLITVLLMGCNSNDQGNDAENHPISNGINKDKYDLLLDSYQKNVDEIITISQRSTISGLTIKESSTIAQLTKEMASISETIRQDKRRITPKQLDRYQNLTTKARIALGL